MYGWLVLLELAIASIGFSLTSKGAPLASALVMASTGVPLLALYLKATRGRLPIRAHLRGERWVVGRLSVGNVITTVALIVGIDAVGIGAMMTMSATGTLFVKKRGTRMGILKILVRVMAAVGVGVVHKPWTMFGDLDKSTVIGLACGVLCAWSFWNYVTVFFGDRIPLRDRIEVVAVADLLSVPLIALAVWVAEPFVGGGYSELWTKDVLLWGSVAGVVGFTIPTIITSKAAGKVEESLSGMLYVLDTPIANAVGLVGASLGVLEPEQAPDAWGWLGMVIVAVAVAISTKLSEEPGEDAPLKGS